VHHALGEAIEANPVRSQRGSLLEVALTHPHPGTPGREIGVFGATQAWPPEIFDPGLGVSLVLPDQPSDRGHALTQNAGQRSARQDVPTAGPHLHHIGRIGLRRHAPDQETMGNLQSEFDATPPRSSRCVWLRRENLGHAFAMACSTCDQQPVEGWSRHGSR
jgi:hypothetical protein